MNVQEQSSSHDKSPPTRKQSQPGVRNGLLKRASSITRLFTKKRAPLDDHTDAKVIDYSGLIPRNELEPSSLLEANETFANRNGLSYSDHVARLSEARDGAASYLSDRGNCSDVALQIADVTYEGSTADEFTQPTVKSNLAEQESISGLTMRTYPAVGSPRPYSAASHSPGRLEDVHAHPLDCSSTQVPHPREASFLDNEGEEAANTLNQSQSSCHHSLVSTNLQDMCVSHGSSQYFKELGRGKQIDENFYPFAVGPMRPEAGSEFNPQGAPKPTNEVFRLQVLKAYNLLDTGPEAKFDRLTALATQMFQTPVALVSLVDSDRQFFKSNIGLEGCSQTDRESSFCAFTLLPSPDVCVVVEDALLDSRFSQNKLVVGPPYIRFYAGAPLLTSGGFILGSLCVIAYEPHKFGSQERELLLSLAQLVVMEIEKHTKALELQRNLAERFEEDKRGLLAAIDAFSEGLVLVDAMQKEQPIVFVNEGWEKITGYTLKEAVGRHSGSILQGPLTDMASVAQLRAACMEGRSATVEILNYRRDGTPFWNWLRIRPVQSALGTTDARLPATANRGASKYYFGILSDCTGRREKEMQLEKMRLEELEKQTTLKAKRQFVANISHEIRTPMNAIIACSQLLQETSNLTADQRELAQMINGSGQQLLSLINDILDFSKLDAKKMDLQVKEFSLWGCLDFCMEMLVLKSQNKGLDLSYNAEASVPQWIWADEVRLRQVLTNLLSNAAKFTNEGGEVEVSVKCRPHAWHQLTEGFLKVKEPYEKLPCYELEFSVRDTGIGMPKEFANVIFEAFTQCDNSRTRKYEGTGLGMAIAKELTECMKGRIWLESEVGRGTTFYFTILAHGSMREVKDADLARMTQSEMLALQLRPVTPLTGRRVLLIGVNRSFQRMVESMLQAWGVQIVVAHDLEELHLLWGDPSSAIDRTSRLARALSVPNGLGSCQAPHPAFSSPVTRREFASIAQGAKGANFDAVLVDSPTPSINKQVSQRHMGSFLMQHEMALAMMQLGCACGSVLPTFLFLAKHAGSEADLDSTRLANITVLSRPARVNQVYQALLEAFATGEIQEQRVEKEEVMGEDSVLNILIAEDNVVNQRVLVKLLNGMNQPHCMTAINGKRVLELVPHHEFDLILMDVQMPEMDGLEATTHIRKSTSISKQPIITALTADVGPGIEAECVEAGMNWYLSKPVRKADLSLLLEKVILHKRDPEGQPVSWLNR